MIMRGHRTQRMVMASIFELAAMAHEAEDSGDDLTAIGLMEELEVRGGDAVNRFGEAYRAQLIARAAVRRTVSQEK